MSQPTQIFWDSVCTAGSIVVDCGFCGRTNFVSDGDYEDGELEQLRVSAKHHPDQFYEQTDCDYISCGQLDGLTVVHNCPCGKAERYERFIWENRLMIVDYLKRRAAKAAREASQDLEVVAGVNL